MAILIFIFTAYRRLLILDNSGLTEAPRHRAAGPLMQSAIVIPRKTRGRAECQPQG